jgi:uncharacterized phage protein (TIGR01671 family)
MGKWQMRQIKFRAWDNEKKRMIEDGCLDPEWRKLWLSIDFGGGVSVRTEEWGSEDHESVEKTFDIASDRITLEQFSGLHDKNGREIYEGDVVRRYDYNVHRNEPVIFYEGGFEPFTGMGDFDLSPSACEVIGNIHENPELIKTNA